MRLYSFFYFIKHLVNKILLLDFEMLKVKILVMSDFLDANNEELLKDYFSEAELMVDNLESNILAIENDPANHDAIDEIFRAAHTLKGNSATVEFTEISTFAHKMEDLLDEVRSDRVQVTEDVVDTLLNSLDIIKAMLEARQNGSVYAESVEEISNKIKSFIPEKAGKGKNSSPAPKPVSAPACIRPAYSPRSAQWILLSYRFLFQCVFQRIIMDIAPDFLIFRFVSNHSFIAAFCHIPAPICLETHRFICPTTLESVGAAISRPHSSEKSRIKCI